MISTDIKTDVKQEIKELIAVPYNFSQKYLLKIEIKHIKQADIFSFNLGWHSFQFDLLTLQRPGFFEGRKAGRATSTHHLPFLYF